VRDVVGDIPQVLLEVFFDAVLVEAVGDLVEHSDEGYRRALEVDDLAGQLVDAPGDAGVSPEDLRLDLVNIVREARNDGKIPVDDRVEDGVEHGFGAAGEQVWRVLQPRAHNRQVGRFAVANRDHEVASEEDMQFAELHLLFGIEVPSGPEHDEEGRSVALDLGALMGENRVFDREFVQAELASERRELLGGGAVEADPGHSAGAGVERRKGIAERCGRLDAASVLIDRVVDQAGARPPGLRGFHARRSRGCSRSQRQRAEGLAKIGSHGPNGSPDR